MEITILNEILEVIKRIDNKLDKINDKVRLEKVTTIEQELDDLIKKAIKLEQEISILKQDTKDTRFDEDIPFKVCVRDGKLVLETVSNAKEKIV